METMTIGSDARLAAASTQAASMRATDRIPAVVSVRRPDEFRPSA
jgi:hypothetical protein